MYFSPLGRLSVSPTLFLPRMLALVSGAVIIEVIFFGAEMSGI